ncbi:Pentatricopeptide repeat (PPR) superfamily protein [Euphorbia peplus]|nr:Pentatricopeptide repeat (PPR) superfamily protein [Euphorbia peplus]
MLSSTFARRLNPTKIFIPRSISSETLNPRPNPQNFDPNTVSQTLSCYGNDWKSALDFFNWVESHCSFQHTSDTYNRMIDILGKFFEFHLSWNLIHRMTNSHSSIPNHTTFRILFKRYASARLVTEALSAYDRLHEFNLKDDTSYCNLIDALCEHKHVIEAHALCFGDNMVANNEMVAKNRTKICNMILRGWFKMGWWNKCREFWEEMDRHGVDKSLHSYSIYMDILCKGGKPWKTVKLYKDLKRKGVKLDVVAYNTVVHAIGLSEGVDSAVGVYREMADLGCVPNVVTCNTIIKLLCENYRVMEAYKVLDEMCKKDIVPDVMTYHCFFGCLEKPQEILSLFDSMIESGVRPRMDTYVMLMRKFGRWGFLRPVLIVWEKMEEHGCSPNESAYNALIDALIEKGQLDLARKYDQEMLAKGLSPKPRKELRTNVVEEV